MREVGLGVFRQRGVVSACVALLLSFGAVACGGGGGGGGAGPEKSATTGVRVLHAAIDAAPVDVVVAGTPAPVAQRAVFGLDNGYHRLPSGSYNLTLTRTGSPEVVVDVLPVAVTERSKVGVLLYGDNATFGLKTTLLAEVPSDLGDAVQIRFVDGVTGAAEVRFSISAGAESEVVTVPFGQESPFVQRAAGEASIRAVRAVDGRVLAAGTFMLEAGKAYTFLIAGEAEYFVKGLLVQE